jgi:hypothetical protein
MVAACALVSACVDRGPRAERQIDPAYVEANLLEAIPDELDHRVEADLGGVVIYVGNQLLTEQVARGEEVRVVHYWQVIEPPGEAWRVFSHAVGATRSDWLNVDATDMRAGYPPGRWQAGDVIRDEQVFVIPSAWRSDHVDLRIGLYRRGGQSAGDRLTIRSGPADDESRVHAARIPLGGEAREGAEPYAIRRASGAIAIDGRGDDAAWAHAPRSPAFVVAEGGRDMQGEARARLLWDDDYLYALIEVEDASIYSEYENDGDPLWRQDVVEIFIDADRRGRGYVELQVNPRGARYDAFFATTRAGGGDAAWSSGMRAAVDVRGDPTRRRSADEGWTAELAIPLAAVVGTSEHMDVRLPPQVGDRWNLNIVRVDEVAEGAISASSWSQISISDFHALDRMLTVVFADEEGHAEVAAAEVELDAEIDEAPAGEVTMLGEAAERAPRGETSGARLEEVDVEPTAEVGLGQAPSAGDEGGARGGARMQATTRGDAGP